MKTYRISYKKLFLSGIFQGHSLVIVEEFSNQKLAFNFCDKIKQKTFFDRSGNLCQAKDVNFKILDKK